MARYDDIATAYRESIKISPHGRRTVTTVDFVQNLAKYNHIWTLREANEWIEIYQLGFKDISTEEGERLTFQLFNPNNGIKSRMQSVEFSLCQICVRKLAKQSINRQFMTDANSRAGLYSGLHGC